MPRSPENGKAALPWQELTPGMHVKLGCGCQGFVLSVNSDPVAADEGRGFVLAYTTALGCGGGRWAEDSYMRGNGPYCNAFNYNLCESAAPITPSPVPAWWTRIFLARRHDPSFLSVLAPAKLCRWCGSNEGDIEEPGQWPRCASCQGT